jgi:RNA polymerase sigma factor (sigma-70 family)
MSADESTDLARLLELLKKSPHDTSTWARFFESAWPFVLLQSHSLLGRSGRMADAEDIAQGVFWLLSRSVHDAQLDVPQTDDEVRRLLRVMVRNQTRDLLRHERRFRRDIRREVAAADDTALASKVALPQDQVQCTEIVEQVLAKLDSLDQEVFRMQIAGSSEIEIAQRLQASTRTIRRRLQRIRTVLREIVAG